MHLAPKQAKFSTIARAAGKGKKVAGKSQEPELLSIVPSKPGFESPVKQPARRTAYRKPSTKEHVASIKAAKRQEEQEQLRGLSQPGPKRGPRKPPVMLIDAYNILFQDPYLKEWLEKEPDFARGELAKWVAAYADAANIKCQLVYDAMGSKSKSEGTFMKVSNRVIAVFVSQREADTYIVSKAWNYKEKRADSVIVVSSDRQIIIGVTDEDMDITCRAADEFLEVIKACSKGNTSGIRRYTSLPGTADLSWYARRPAASTGQGIAQSSAQPACANAADSTQAALELEDTLEGILWKYGAYMSLADLCDGDNSDDCLIEDSIGDSGAAEGAGNNSLDLDSLDDLLSSRIV